jgi:hypothetical protein
MIFGLYYYGIDFRFKGIPYDQLPPSPTINETALSSGPSLPIPVDAPYFSGSGLFLVILGAIVCGLLLWSQYKNTKLAHPSALLWLFALVAICFGLIAFGIALVLVGLLSQAPLPLKNTQQLPRQIVNVYAPGLVVVAALFFLSFTLTAPDFVVAAKSALNYLLNYPNVYYKVVRPWLLAIPVTTIVMATMLIPLLWVSLAPSKERSSSLTSTRYLFSILIGLALMVGLLDQPYRISRYTYFLYPVVLVLASISIVQIAQHVEHRYGLRSPLVLIAAFGILVLTEDFGITHLVRINDPVVRYRLDYNDDLAAHYYKRWDIRGVAEYTNQHLGPDDRVLVFHQSLAHYLDQTDGIFVRKGSKIHSIIWGCGGTRELWSNASLLDEDHEVYEIIETNKAATWLIMHTQEYRSRDPLEADLIETFDLKPSYTSVDGNLAVYRVSGEEVELQERT